MLKGQDGKDNVVPVSTILSSLLADAHHQVRMLVATSAERYAGASFQVLKHLECGLRAADAHPCVQVVSGGSAQRSGQEQDAPAQAAAGSL